MRILNEYKTQELNRTTLDYSIGYLKRDKLFIAHHEAVGDKKAYDEYEDIQVYVLYNAEELNAMLRAKRVSLLNAFDKWEKAVLRGREQDDYVIMAWYSQLKDLNENAFKNIPARIKYYLGDL